MAVRAPCGADKLNLITPAILIRQPLLSEGEGEMDLTRWEKAGKEAGGCETHKFLGKKGVEVREGVMAWRRCRPWRMASCTFFKTWSLSLSSGVKRLKWKEKQHYRQSLRARSLDKLGSIFCWCWWMSKLTTNKKEHEGSKKNQNNRTFMTLSTQCF